MTKPKSKTKLKKAKSASTGLAPVSVVHTRGSAWIGIAAAGIGLLVYLNTLGHQFCLDDFSVLKENWITKGGLKNLGLIFSTEYRSGYWAAPGTLYRPLPLVLFTLQWAVSPDNPLMGHLCNVLLYATLGWVLWITWRRVFAQYHPVLPAIAVLLFMVHPVHTEVVANIKSIDEILALLFSNLALYALWRHFENPDSKWIWIAPVFFGVALFSKESAITYLAIFPLAIWFFTDRNLKDNLRVSALFLIPAVLFLVARYQVLSSQSHVEPISPIDNFIVIAEGTGSQLASALMMCGRYLQTLTIPFPLVSDLGYAQFSPVGFSDWRALLSLVLLGSMVVWAMMHIRQKHFLAFAILLFFIPFSISSNLFMLIGTAYAERTLFSPSLGFVFAVAWIIQAGFSILPESKRTVSQQVLNPHGKGKMIWAIAGLLLLTYSILTVLRNPAWYDSYTLYSADIQHAPKSAKLNYLLGLEKVKASLDVATGEVSQPLLLREAIKHYDTAIDIYPENPDAYGSRGLAYSSLKMYNNTYADYITALRYRPNHERILANLGFIYVMRNQLDSAEYVFQKAVNLNPGFVEAWRNLGAVKAHQKKYDEAIGHWMDGLKYDPRNSLLMNYIGNAYREMGRTTEANVWLERAEELK